jgi:hypothetical protein
MESVRFVRWVLAPYSTAKLWRIMKLWELRSYDTAIDHERSKLIYQAHLSAQFGRGWRRRAPVQTLLPLRLARYGVPLSETAGAGLAAAGIDPAVLPRAVHGRAWPSLPDRPAHAPGGTVPEQPVRLPAALPHEHGAARPVPAQESHAGPGEVRPADGGPHDGGPDDGGPDDGGPDDGGPGEAESAVPDEDAAPGQTTAADRYYAAWRRYIDRHGEEPSGDQLSAWLAEHNVMGRHGNPVSPGHLRRYLPEFRYYEAWRRHADEHGRTLTAAQLTDLLAGLGIARGGERVPVEVLESMLPDFHRRRAIEAVLVG